MKTESKIRDELFYIDSQLEHYKDLYSHSLNGFDTQRYIVNSNTLENRKMALEWVLSDDE